MAILVAIGDDDRFEVVLGVASQFAREMDRDLTIAHVTASDNASASDRDFRDEVQSFVAEADVEAEVRLEHLNRSGLRSGTAIGKQLVDIAEDVEIDHVVVGHRSKTQLAELRDGHTGFVVAQEATVPVTIVSEAVEL